MVGDILCDKMDRKTKKEQKKKKKWGLFRSSSRDVVVSAAAPADHPKSSSSWKRKFPSLRRAFRRMLSLILPVSSSDTHTDASSSSAVSGSSDPELDLLPFIQEKEAIRAVPKESSTSSSNSDGSSSSAESKPSDLESSRGCSSFSAVGDSSSDGSERIDLLAELQGTVVPEDAAGDQTVSDVDLDCVLDVLASVTAQSNGLSQTEILQLIQCSPPQREPTISRSSSRETRRRRRM
ncbi:hypothetical protein R3I93_020104 [Phoxinus phoxinus]|uniref:Uncharacterized protein n=1 Tax=Phoxinus phoxinus TaxID=58324 RepID=A0AAN9C7X9_9TELE